MVIQLYTFKKALSIKKKEMQKNRMKNKTGIE
jgi:hypothetical protein